MRRQYVAERYEPGLTTEQARRAAGLLTHAARSLTREGTDVAFLGSTFVPDDEAVFSAFETSSAELVEAAHRLASVPVDRVVEALSLPREAEKGRET